MSPARATTLRIAPTSPRSTSSHTTAAMRVSRRMAYALPHGSGAVGKSAGQFVLHGGGHAVSGLGAERPRREVRAQAPRHRCRHAARGRARRRTGWRRRRSCCRPRRPSRAARRRRPRRGRGTTASPSASKPGAAVHEHPLAAEPVRPAAQHLALAHAGDRARPPACRPGAAPRPWPDRRCRRARVRRCAGTRRPPSAVSSPRMPSSRPASKPSALSRRWSSATSSPRSIGWRK